MTLPRRRRPERRPGFPADDGLVRQMLRVGAGDPALLGYALASTREAAGQTPEQQAEALGLTVQALGYLAITRRPQPGRGEGLDEIAARFGVGVEVLARLLREATGEKGEGDGGA